MEAPTPASALIHSSTLVVAGIFLIMRFNFIFEFTPHVNNFLLILGTITLSSSSIIAFFQKDVKKLVAYSTISQIGYLVAGCGSYALYDTLFYLILHAINKAFLFMFVGYIVHFFFGNTDMRYMGSLSFFFLDFAIIIIVVSLNLIGFPYSAGFIGKEMLILNMFLSNSLKMLISSL